jgi:mannose-6-phosphate isomerase-like protein (cupin superfamily)
MYKTRQDELTEDTSGASSGRHAWWAITDSLCAATGGMVGIGELDPSTEAGLHRHRNAEEAMVVIGGGGTVLTPAGEQPAPEGTLIYAPSGSWHGLHAGDDGIRILMIYGGPTAPSDIDYDPLEGEPDADAPAAAVMSISDAEEIPFHEPSQNFFHLIARWLVDDEHIASETIVVGHTSFAADEGAHGLHCHPLASEFLFVLSGSGFHVNPDGSEVEVQPGDLTYVAPSEWHGFRNHGSEKALAIFGYLGARSLAEAGYELPDTVSAHRAGQKFLQPDNPVAGLE